MFGLCVFDNVSHELHKTVSVSIGNEYKYEKYQSKNNPEILYEFHIPREQKIEDLMNVVTTIKDQAKDEFNILLDEQVNAVLFYELLYLAFTDINIYSKDYVESKKVIIKSAFSDFELAHNNAYSYNVARLLTNLPYQALNPDLFVHYISEILKDTDISVEINRLTQCSNLQLNGMTTLSKASSFEPAFVKISYNNSSSEPIGLVGKGVTIDTGGQNLKSGDLLTIKGDMSGAAAVIGSILRLALNGTECNVNGYLMITDNMLNDRAFMPGDVIKYPNNKSVEIGNTDAEGRLILADGLLLASSENKTVIDIATLTGNVGMALGNEYAAIFSNQLNQDYISFINENCTDKVWPLPLVDNYRDSLKGNISDLKNISNLGFAGCITAALFLEEFIKKDTKWYHVDMAAMNNKHELGTTVSGYGVRLLSQMVVSMERESNNEK